MGKIIILDENTSNQIAAGEVIENPASVIKELVENSIDAKATEIFVEIKKGGISYISIADNGTGIALDDTEMAFERHGTSKIRSSNDLNSISTMGFRGEALASVASVSDITMSTRTIEDEFGVKLNIKGGDIIYKQKTAKEIGTKFVIKSLFYNTPVRYKFLKNDSTEARYCIETLTNISLAYPNIAFTLISNKKEVLKTPGDGILMNTIYSVYGREYINNITLVNHDAYNMHITGYVGNKTIARGNRKQQSFYINNRYIKSKEIISALEKAYETFLMRNKFPFCILKIEIDNSEVDVNVHPAKREVRFTNSSNVYSLVYNGVKNALEGNRTIYQEPEKKEYKKDIFQEETPKYVQEDVFNYSEKKQIHEQLKELQNNEIKITQAEVVSIEEAISENIEENNNIIEEQKEFIGNYTIVGQIFNTYIILQRKEDILLIDQHAAHERITYEKLLGKYQKKVIEKQMLLLPLEIHLTSSEMLVVDEEKVFLGEIGFEFDVFSENSIVLRSVPIEISHSSCINVFRAALDKLVKKSYNATRLNIEKDALYMMACKNAIKANQILSNQEIEVLVQKLSVLDNPHTCPHGRPTIIKMDKKEFEKKFKRIV